MTGTVIDQQTYDGVTQELAKHPGLKVVGTVYGDWDDATAQSAVARVLPTLPKVNGVIINGGGYGVAQAFAAAKMPTPLIYFGNRGFELKWWAEQLAKGAYPSESSSTTPSVSTAAFWLAVNVVNGVKVNEPYVHGAATEPLSNQTTWTVQPERLFVMGDNRLNSTDSRADEIGEVCINDVIGRAVVRYWPLDTIGIIQTPTYPNVPSSQGAQPAPTPTP